MASVGDWSDSDIRSKLAELGSPVGPVTDTTRKILVKKLKQLLQNNAGKGRRGVNRFSSGEDDSQDDAPSMPPPTSRVRTLRRRTVGTSDINSVNDSIDIPVLRESSTTNKATTKVTRKSMSSVVSSVGKDDFDSGSDSDVPQKSFDKITSRKSLKTEPLTPSRQYMSPRPESNLSSKTFLSSRPESNITSRTFMSPRSESTSIQSHQFIRTEREPDFSISEERPGISHRQIPIRTSLLPSERERFSRTLETNRIYDTVPSYRRSVTKDEDNESTGFHSEFLSRLQEQNRSREGSYQPPSTHEATSPGVYSRSSIAHKFDVFDKYKTFDFVNDYRRRISNATRDIFSSGNRGDPKVHIRSKEESSGSKFHFITPLCSGLALILLFIVGIIYINYSSDALGLESDENTYPICSPDSSNQSTSQVCIESKHLQPSLNLLKILTPKLQELAVRAYCDGNPESEAIKVPSMTEQAAVDYLLTRLPGTPKRFQVEQDIRRMKILVLANPQWDILVVGDKTADVKTLVVVGGLAARNLDLPFMCSVRLFLYRIGWWVVCGVLILGTIALVLYGVKVYKRQKDRHNNDVYAMVNKVLQMLCNHYEQEMQLGYLSVDNCRDELIQPMHRASMKNVWDAAVDFIEKHESRVRTEMHNVRGENVKIWRWLPANGPPMSPSGSTSTSSPYGPKLDRLM